MPCMSRHVIAKTAAHHWRDLLQAGQIASRHKIRSGDWLAWSQINRLTRLLPSCFFLALHPRVFRSTCAFPQNTCQHYKRQSSRSSCHPTGIVYDCQIKIDTYRSFLLLSPESVTLYVFVIVFIHSNFFFIAYYYDLRLQCVKWSSGKTLLKRYQEEYLEQIPTFIFLEIIFYRYVNIEKTRKKKITRKEEICVYLHY